MASITKRKSKYSVVYDFYDDEGVRHQKWETWGTYAEAKKRKAEIEHKQTNNTFVKPSIKTVSELMYDFMNLYGVNAWALSTYDGKKGLIDNYINPIIGKVKIKDITPRFMDEYYRKLLKVQRVMRNGQSFEGETVSPRNVREIHKILNCAFNQAVRWELLESNPVSKATLPKCENNVRDIWTMEDLSKALEVCEDDRLALAIHLAFSCSLRLGEIMGLTWDCLTIDEESIREHNASLFVEKELQRVSKNAMNVLESKDVLKVFPAVLVSDSTILVFKKPKTKTSIRRVWLPETVARMLVDWKKQQEEQKRYLGSEYHDYNIVLALPNGRPMEGQVISRLFNAMIRKNDLPKVVFHSLRHSSTTYKLKLNNGDMKAVQGDTGHAQLKMVSDVYSHILDEDRRYNAEKMERDFYKKAEEKVSTEPTAKPTNAATEQLMNLLNSSPDLAAQLLQMLTANQTGQAVTA